MNKTLDKPATARFSAAAQQRIRALCDTLGMLRAFRLAFVRYREQLPESPNMESHFVLGEETDFRKMIGAAKYRRSQRALVRDADQKTFPQLVHDALTKLHLLTWSAADSEDESLRAEQVNVLAASGVTVPDLQLEILAIFGQWCEYKQLEGMSIDCLGEANKLAKAWGCTSPNGRGEQTADAAMIPFGRYAAERDRVIGELAQKRGRAENPAPSPTLTVWDE